MYKVVFLKSAYKEYQKLPLRIKRKVDELLQMLSVNPLAEVLKYKKLRGIENHYRIRSGDYRIVYSVVENELIIEVVRVAHRKDVYKFL